MKAKPTFTRNDINQDIRIFLEVEDKKIKMALIYIGLQIVTEARQKTKIIKPPPLDYPHEKSGFYDLTGNLRSSIGFEVQKDKKTIEKNFAKTKNGSEGYSKGMQKAKEIANKYNGWVLTIVAGMDYAVLVESKGYDVISSSVWLKEKVKSQIKNLTVLK